MDRKGIVEAARTRAAFRWPTVDLRRGCFFNSLAMLEELKRHDVTAILQAGSHSWPRIRPEEDDGECSTHFSYVWEPHSLRTRQMITMGMLPELHVWLYVPRQRWLIDISTVHLKHQCAALGDMAWTAPDPPDFLWCLPRDVPSDVLYRADPQAIGLVLSYADRIAMMKGAR